MRDKTEPNDSAFPGDVSWVVGLTKREYFAAMAMQGLLASPDLDVRELSGGDTMKASVHAADALIEALNAENKK